MIGPGLVFRLGVGVILLVVVISGPVAPVDFTPDRASAGSGLQAGTGEIAFSVESVPSAAVFERGKYGTGTYVLRVPDAVIRVEQIRGQALVAYKIRIPALRLVRTSVHAVDERAAGQDVVLSLEPMTRPRDAITASQYEARLAIVARGVENDGVRFQRNITIGVDAQ